MSFDFAQDTSLLSETFVRLSYRSLSGAEGAARMSETCANWSH